MLGYGREFLLRLLSHWAILAALGLDAVGIIALAIANLGTLTIWWPLLVVGALVVLQLASFLAFVDVRRQIEPSLAIRATESTRGLARVSLYANGTIQVYGPLHCRFVNNGDDARIVKLRMLWVSESPFSQPKRVREIPLVAIGTRDVDPDFELPVPKATQTADMELHFEAAWDTTADDRAKLSPRFRLLLDIDVAGQPSFVVPIAKYHNDQKWKLPPKNAVTTVHPKMLLTFHR